MVSPHLHRRWVLQGIVSTWDAEEHVVGNIFDVQRLEVLGSLKSDSSMGRAMPELVEGSAMVVAAMWASRVGKRVEER